MYTIDYGTSITEKATTLEEAQEIADDGAAYTQCDIVILDDNGAEIARRRWNGIPYNPEETEEADNEIISFGDFGYYSPWDYYDARDYSGAYEWLNPWD